MHNKENSFFSSLSAAAENKSYKDFKNPFENTAESESKYRKAPVPMPNLEVVREIGHGAFGKCNFEANRDLGYVFEAIDKNTGETVALKRTMKVGNVVSREYEVLTLLKDCTNVVQLLDFFYSVDQR